MVDLQHHIFVCSSCRIKGQQMGKCYAKGSANLIQRFLEIAEEKDLSGKIMITNTGCFGICDKGSVVLVYPEGVWYGNVSEDDVDKIMEKHILGGNPVEELRI